MNNQKKKISTGVEDFKEIIDKNGYFVDKTLMIRELLESNAKVTLFTRPRRFGKTLNQSMIKRFLEDEITEHGERIDNSYLFDGLAISRCSEDILKHQQQYPVIFLSLKSAKQPDYSKAYESIIDDICKEFVRHSYVLTKDMPARNRRIYEKIMMGEGSYIEYAKSLALLSEILAGYHGKNAVILIDEYDVPLENSYTRGFYDEMMGFIRSLFESALKTNPYLEKGIITGCLRISRESIFTGLNNLNVQSILSSHYNDCFGFTEEEVREILAYYGFSDRYDEVREWYDGYMFGNTEIYNPWSILSYIYEAQGKGSIMPAARAYWSNTSSNSIVKELIYDADSKTRNELELLMNGGTIEKPVHEDITYEDIHVSQDNLWNFLFFTGYLKMKSMHTDDGTVCLELAIPNREVREIYKRTVRGWLDDKIKNADSAVLLKALEQGDCKTAENFINTLFEDTISYFDCTESFYHGLLAGLLARTGGYRMDSNRESGYGRYDLVFRTPAVRKGRVIILEFKVADSVRTLEAKCDEALKQIEDKKYAEPFISEGYPVIRKYGISFCGQECMVKQGEMYGGEQDN